MNPVFSTFLIVIAACVIVAALFCCAKRETGGKEPISEVFTVSFDCRQPTELEIVQKNLADLQEQIRYRGAPEKEYATSYFGEKIEVGMSEKPTPQLKDRIRLIEETLGIEYEQVPAKPEVPATWKAKKKRKARV